MTKEFYEDLKVSDINTRFGGLISFSDFNTNYRDENKKGSLIAKDIFAAWRFDEQCRKNIESRNRKREKGNTYGEE